MDYHEMNGYQEGRVIIWNCPICGRRVVLVGASSPMIVEQGDVTVNHRGGIGGLTIGAVLIEETPDPFEQWAGENVERLFGEE